MTKTLRHFATGLALALSLSSLAPHGVAAQGRGNRDRAAVTAPDVTLSVELRTQIRDFYSARPASEAEALPPGMRRRLERGKPLPPGIAKRNAPEELASRVDLPDGYELVEVGLDVLLVEIATDIVHDVLTDIIR